MSSSLEGLLRGLNPEILGNPATEIGDVVYDSRQLEPGALFVALRGEATDGHRFLHAATEAGASALLVEEVPSPAPEAVAIARVDDTRSALAEVADKFFGSPSTRMTLIGVTGTNGKTSTVRMIEAILKRAGISAGSIDTISARFGSKEEPSRLTTPESVDLQRMLSRMERAGVDHVALEVSSHSLVQQRVRTLRFGVCVFTQLSQDHLDFHGDMQSYGEAKGMLFSPPYLAGPAVLNADDPWTEQYTRNAETAGFPVLRFARGIADTELVATDEEIGLARSRFVVEFEGRRHPFELPLAGDFQIDNALAAIGACVALEIPWDEIVAGLAETTPVPGRLECVGQEPVVLVDYAHTPDALDRVLARVRPLVRGSLITVFGCGGNRDRSKRAPMAAAASRNSDYTIATSDNPREENPEEILDEVREGLLGRYEIIVDRREAIQRAIAIASEQDTVVIAGKGHENYQIIGQDRTPFDDREEARTALALRPSGGDGP